MAGGAGVELGHRFETLRHVAIECEATGGKEAMARTAAWQEKQCRGVVRLLDGEAGAKPAQAAAMAAAEGWRGVQDGTRVTVAQWKHMQHIVAGAMPPWVPQTPEQGKVQGKAAAVAKRVHCMQAGLQLRAEKHRERGQRSVKWIREREDNRPWLRHVLRAWKAGEGVRGVPGAVAARPAIGNEAEAHAAAARAVQQTRLDSNLARLVGYGRLVLQRDQQRVLALRRWQQAGEWVQRKVVARRRLQAAMVWVRRVMLRARVRQMLARRVVRTTTAVGTVHSMGSNQQPDGAAATTTPAAHAATGTRRQMALHNAARAGVRVMALVRSCEPPHTGANIAAIATNTANTATNGIYNG